VALFLRAQLIRGLIIQGLQLAAPDIFIIAVEWLRISLRKLMCFEFNVKQ
jgi:hypothetical protein